MKPSPDDIHRFLDGRMEADEKARFETRAVEEAAVFDELYDEVLVRDALQSAPERRARRRRLLASALVLAAAASLAAVLISRPDSVHPPVHRGTDDASLRAVSPRGATAGVTASFLWTRDPEAASYRFELFDERGQRVLVGVVTDTIFVLPSEMPSIERGAWRATALDALGIDKDTTGTTEFRGRMD